jgi:hypothetical protein
MMERSPSLEMGILDLAIYLTGGKRMTSRTRLLVALGCLATMTVLVSGCSAPSRYHVGPMLGYYDIEGDVSATSGTSGIQVEGDTTADEMGLDSEVGVAPSFKAEWDDFIVGLSGLYVNYSGDGTARETLSVGNGPGIQAGSDISSDVTLWYLAVEGMYRVLKPDDFMELGVGLGLGAAEYALDIKGQGALGGRIKTDGVIPFGYLTAMLAKDLGRFRLQVVGRGVSVHLTGDDVEDIEFLEADGSASYILWGEDQDTQGRVVLGYRYLKVKYSEDYGTGSLAVDAHINGPYLGFVVVF